MQRLLLSYDCPECGTEFKQECIFAADSDEFRKIRAQLPRPFLTGENVCYKQRTCGNSECGEKRQVPVLQIGVVVSAS